MKHFESLCSNKMENSEDVHIFLDTYELRKLNKEDMKTLNNPVSGNKIKEAIKKLSTKQSLDPNRFTDKFYKNFREDLMLILSNSNEIERQDILQNSSLEHSIFLKPKPGNNS